MLSSSKRQTPLEALLTSRFATRQAARSALALHEFTTNRAAMRCLSNGGRKKAVYGCASPSCTLQYCVAHSETDGGYWHFPDPPLGIHNLCVPISKRPLSLLQVMALPGVAAQLAVANNRIEPQQVPSSSIVQAAKDHKIDLTPSDVGRIQALNTAKLTDVALGGYDKVAWYCHELVRLNPGTKAFLQVRCVATGDITEHIYSTSKSSPSSVDLSAPLPMPSRLELYSCIIFPASTFEIVQGFCSSIYSDFAHMYHFEHETKLLVWLLTTQLGLKIINLGYGLVVGPENTYWWQYVREVRFSLVILHSPIRRAPHSCASCTCPNEDTPLSRSPPSPLRLTT